MFVSYSRDDQRIARRIRNALVSLGISVVWDEDMPGVEWRTYIKNSIDSLAAVVVLWTDISTRSESVMSEALQAVRQDKLVNSLHGIAQPPYPFHEINGAGLDSWEAGLSHAGWEKLVATLDALIASKDGDRRPGGLIAAYRSQLMEVKQRKAELKTAEGEGAKRLRARTKAVKDCATAQHRVERFDVQLGELKALNVSKKTLVAAMDELEEAQGLASAAQQQLAELDDSNEQAEIQLDGMRENLKEYLVSIGGSGDGENSYLTPPPAPIDEPVFVEPEAVSEPQPEPDPQPVPEPKVQQPSVPVQPQTVAEPATAKVISAPVKFANAAPNTTRRGSPPSLWERYWPFAIAAVGAVLALLAYAWPSRPVEDAGPTVEQAAPAASASAPANIVIDVTQTPFEAAKAKLGWLLADNWVLNKAKYGCGTSKRSFPIALSDDGTQLVFLTGPESFTLGKDGKSITTTTSRYELLAAGSVRITNLKMPTAKSELSKCAV